MGYTYGARTDDLGNMIGELGVGSEDSLLAGLMKFWGQDTLRKIKEEQEHERSLGSSHVEFGGGDTHELDQWTRDFVSRIANMGVRPSGGMALGGVSQSIRPFVHTAQGVVRREAAPTMKRIQGKMYSPRK
jgi:hypothetical protein